MSKEKTTAKSDKAEANDKKADKKAPAAAPAADKKADKTVKAPAELVACAVEMNEVMGLKPAIDTDLDAESLTKAVRKNMRDVAPEDFAEGKTSVKEEIEGKVTKVQKFSAESWTVLKDLGCKAAGGKKEKKAGKGRYTRYNAVADAIKSGTKDVEKLITKADACFTEHGGSSSPKEMKIQVSRSICLLVALGLGELDNGSFSYKGE